MASISKYAHKDGSPRWRVRYMLNGKRMTKAGFKSMNDARRYASVKEAEKYTGKASTEINCTLSEYIDIFMELDTVDLSPATIVLYNSFRNILNKTDIANKKIGRINSDDIKLLIKTWQAQNVKSSTINARMTFLGTIFNRAIKNREIQYSPMANVNYLKAPKHEHIILTPDEYKRLLEAAQNSHMYLPILLGGYMGLRKGEVLGLRWDDINFKENTMTINQTRMIIHKKEIVKTPKTETSKRELYMPPFVIAKLKEVKKKNIIGIDRFVCAYMDGTPIRPSLFFYHFKKLLKKAGLSEKTRFHDLRHTCASLLVAINTPDKEISEYLGHSNISITMDLYAGIFKDCKKDTAQKLDAYIDMKK